MPTRRRRGSRRRTGLRTCPFGYCTAWLDAQGLPASQPILPLVKRLEAELRVCRREVYAYMRRHNSVWLRVVEEHVRGAHRRRRRVLGL